jgi:glutamine amidotransferase
MIQVIDYGVCNSFSVKNAMTRTGYPCSIIKSPKEIIKNSKLILPGIGSFDNGMKNLEDKSWKSFFQNEYDKQNQYLLGFCLGMQLLLNSSEEGNKNGLGLINGNVLKLNSDNTFKIPNMGWRINKFKINHKIIDSIEESNQFYFVHSYYCNVNYSENIIATSKHLINFPSIICSNKIIGIQFHPEKSNIFGMKILSNFAVL